MLIGIVGKPSSGKSTLLNALCMTNAKMGEYPFTTIEPNRGVAFVRTSCPCTKLENKGCSPRNGKCEKGIRFIPVEMLDVAGLVPGASKGKGMGNRFLDDLRRANVLIHVVDASGTTDAEGNIIDDYDPVNDIDWLNDELSAWISSILYKDWDRVSRKLDVDRTNLVEVIQDKLSGLGATVSQIKYSLSLLDWSVENPKYWTEEQKFELSSKLRENILPIVMACNKIDRPKAQEKITHIKSKYPTSIIVQTTGLAELILRKADEKGWIRYSPGTNSFDILLENKNDKKLNTVMTIKEKLFDQGRTTGVIELLEECVFKLLNMIAVFPVEDSTHLTDHDGRILPDVHLVPKGTTAKDFAGKIHTDLANSFIHGLLVNKSNKRVSATYELDHGDILKVVSAAK